MNTGISMGSDSKTVDNFKMKIPKIMKKLYKLRSTELHNIDKIHKNRSSVRASINLKSGRITHE